MTKPVVPAAPVSSGALPKVVLKTHEDRRVRRGHLWVFSNEIEKVPAGILAGGAAHFMTSRQELLGVGYYNPHSLIAGRILDRRDVALDAAFFEKRLRQALALRESLYPGGAYRWVFGESDDLPGLVIDRYNDVCVVESYAAGMDRLMPEVMTALNAIHPWKAIVLRNDVAARDLEHLPKSVSVAQGAIEAPHVFQTDGMAMAADLLQGQKTGFFFDQRDNRAALAAFSKGKRVADVFCHTGGFGLWAARAGAASVVGVDQSALALNLGRLSAEKNGWSDRMTFQEADAFAWLANTPDKFDVLVLDPPKFAASKKQLRQATDAYIRLNALALKRVTGGGILASASCSQHVDREEFRQVLSRAAYEAGRRVRLLSWGGQAKDHPIRLSMPETEYLKFSILQVS